jgi:hypothetical protein
LTSVFNFESKLASRRNTGRDLCQSVGKRCVGTLWLYAEGCANLGWCGFDEPFSGKQWRFYPCNTGGLADELFDGSAKRVFCESNEKTLEDPVDISNHKQVFIDGRLMAAGSNVEIAVNSPQPTGEILIQEDDDEKPWERRWIRIELVASPGGKRHSHVAWFS